MNKNFNYQSSLNLIKASLFDIYENQEQEIGTITDNKEREKHLKDFINLKNIAIMLIEGIEYLYEDKEEPTLQNTNNNSNSFGLKRYYLECSEKELNFAYVSRQLLDRLKNYSTNQNLNFESPIIENEPIEEKQEQIQEQSNNNIDLEIANEEITTDDIEKDDNIFYKEDDKRVRGIIVRSDQFMKLALSRNRQEGVLEEAKEFRKNEVIRKRREEQQKKLKEAEVKLNI